MMTGRMLTELHVSSRYSRVDRDTKIFTYLKQLILIQLIIHLHILGKIIKFYKDISFIPKFQNF